MQNVFVGRQPIFDPNLNVYAYELLYRPASDSESAASPLSGNQLTTKTILNTFFEIGLERLVRNNYAAINLTEDFVLNADNIPFPPSRVILEILEDIPYSEALVEAASRLSAAGYTIALDDYLYNPDHAPLLELANIVKIDLFRLESDELAHHVSELRQFGVKLVAEKVETPQDFIYCRELGFDYFQGYFLSRPQIVAGESLPTNRLTVLNLLSVLHNPDSDPEDLAEAINTDVATSYKLLKLINSAAFNLPRKIESIEQGVLLLGRRKLASWASMLAMSTLDDRPSEILRLAMTRAKMCELIADKAGLKPLESYFTVGLFSALDLLLQRPLNKLIEPLPLSESIAAALLYHEGDLGKVLACVQAYEIADWEHARLPQLNTEEVVISNIEAVTWANGILDTL